MSEITAKIAAKKCTEATGISDADAATLYNLQGTKRLAIVELESFERTETVDDKQTVRMRVLHLELAPTGDVEDFLRDLSQTLYRRRQPAPLDTQLGAETTDDAVRRGRSTLLAVVEAR